MAIRSYIPIDKNDLPDKFEIMLGTVSYVFEITYNESHNRFVVDLYDIELQPIVVGESLILNERLFADIIDDRLPSIDLVPMDESNVSTEVTFENFGEQVFLYIDSLPPNYEQPSLDQEG